MLIIIFYIFGLVFTQGVSNYLMDPERDLLSEDPIP